MHSGHIAQSERHQRILRALMAADHPLSGEEISARVQAEIGKIPQAVSTTIGEMRSDDNQAAGYKVSFAGCWRAARRGEEPGPRQGKDGGTIFVLSQALQPWHDGRPRYWLLAAPGWTARWIIDSAGTLKSAGQRHSFTAENAEVAEKIEDKELFCKTCGKEIDHGYTCSDACNAAWRESMKPKKEGVLF